MAEDVLRRHKLTARAFRRMGQTGILAPDARVELIEGEIIDMPPIGSRHAGTVKQLARILQRAATERAIVQVQDPISLGEHSEPQPDLALLRPRADFYKSSHPTAADVLLIIEVADASLRYDTEIKLPLYARHGVGEVWIVDVEARRLTRYRQPLENGYQLVDAPERLGAIRPESGGMPEIDLGSLFSD